MLNLVNGANICIDIIKGYIAIASNTNYAIGHDVTDTSDECHKSGINVINARGMIQVGALPHQRGEETSPTSDVPTSRIVSGRVGTAPLRSAPRPRPLPPRALRRRTGRTHSPLLTASERAAAAARPPHSVAGTCLRNVTYLHFPITSD